MQKPGNPMGALPGQEKTKAEAPGQMKKMPKMPKMPSPQDLLSHYESQGLDSRQASLKAIDDLQKLLFRVVSSSRGPKADNKAPPDQPPRRLDAVNGRLALLEMKVDSKPGYAGAFAIGMASGAALNGMGSLFPHVLRSLSQIWTSVTDPHRHQ